MPTNLARVAKDKGIKYFLISFVDLFGVLRSKLVPARAIGNMQKEGAGFAGFAAWLDMTPAHPDMFSKPDPNSLIQLPWKPEVAWLAGDLWMDGKEVEASPRVALKHQMARAQKKGYHMKTGVECEYFLITLDGLAISDANDTQEKPCYDQSALMRRYDVISEICDAMIELGWNPYQNDHEDANGQFEMNWEFDDALVTADRHVFFKYMVKAIAEKHGLRATFMPKPFANLTGNGCHAHVSVWDKTGNKNVFNNARDSLGLSKLAYHFLGGILHNADALAAVFNPTVNSYKRIDAQVTLSGATWSPNAITYGGNNRTNMFRIPSQGNRVECRAPDIACNLYLAAAMMLRAGLEGIREELDPGEPHFENMYERSPEELNKLAIDVLPRTLLEAVEAFAADSLSQETFGTSMYEAFVDFKRNEWNAYHNHVSDWERERYGTMF